MGRRRRRELSFSEFVVIGVFLLISILTVFQFVRQHWLDVLTVLSVVVAAVAVWGYWTDRSRATGAPNPFQPSRQVVAPSPKLSPADRWSREVRQRFPIILPDAPQTGRDSGNGAGETVEAQIDSQDEEEDWDAPLVQAEVSKPPVIAGPSLSEQLRAIDWFQFEKIVAAVYLKQGYAVTRRGGANADGGIDLVLEKAGERIAVQCKQWKTWKVRVRPIREFVGALAIAGFQKGIFAALGPFTPEARDLAAKQGIELIDEERIVSMLEAADARFDPEIIALLDDSRKFCPKCEAEMVLRTAAKGANSGNQFWGCSRYPRCRFVLNI